VKKGDIVTIYEDPWTEQKPEGEARIIRNLSGICKFEYEGFRFTNYEVEFLNEPGRTFERTIKETKSEKV